MANTVTIRPVPFGAVATFRVVNFFSNLIGTTIAAYNGAKTRRALSSLSTRQLDDIGLMPGDIQTIAHRVTLLH